METLGDKILRNSAMKFYCKNCHYGTSRKSSYDGHLLSAKHIKRRIGDVLETNGDTILQKICSSKLTCEKCNKEYSSRNGLWKHKQICNSIKDYDSETNDKITDSNAESFDKDKLILMLINQNAELIKETSEFKNIMLEQQTMMMKVIENGSNNTTNNTTNNTNSHNKSFNLQFFLNETCKDAMNIMDFVDSIKLQLSDLEGVGELGYVEGISKIIVKNLKELDVTQRPVHCTDKKRETMYIKDEDKWEKDDEKVKLHKVVRRVTCKNQNLIPKFKEEHPDCGKYHSKFSDQYNKIVVESMGGPGDNDFEKEEKIIKNISKQVFIDKEETL
jgi:hypothetical protein